MKHEALCTQIVGTEEYMKHLEVIIIFSKSLYHEKFEWCHLKGGKCILIFLTSE